MQNCGHQSAAAAFQQSAPQKRLCAVIYLKFSILLRWQQVRRRLQFSARLPSRLAGVLPVRVPVWPPVRVYVYVCVCVLPAQSASPPPSRSSSPPALELVRSTQGRPRPARDPLGRAVSPPAPPPHDLLVKTRFPQAQLELLY